MKATCEICFHRCSLTEGQLGFCGARKNVGGKVICDNYGKITAVGLDPIEKKPLYHFHPGSLIFSVGSYGCNLHCAFCQNSDISQTTTRIPSHTVSPADLVREAASLTERGNIGIAYTYNEPLISFEYVMDCAKLAHAEGLKNVLVTNGTVEEAPLRKLLPWIDAMNVDLKSFSQSFYDRLRGDLASVKRTIRIAAESCHVEVTTLILPGENDSDAEMEALSSWLTGISPEIPYHISRFFPHFQRMDLPPTPVEKIYRLVEIARGNLMHVYSGNC